MYQQNLQDFFLFFIQNIYQIMSEYWITTAEKMNKMESSCELRMIKFDIYWVLNGGVSLE